MKVVLGFFGSGLQDRDAQGDAADVPRMFPFLCVFAGALQNAVNLGEVERLLQELHRPAVVSALPVHFAGVPAMMITVAPGEILSISWRISKPLMSGR